MHDRVEKKKPHCKFFYKPYCNVIVSSVIWPGILQLSPNPNAKENGIVLNVLPSTNLFHGSKFDVTVPFTVDRCCWLLERQQIRFCHQRFADMMLRRRIRLIQDGKCNIPSKGNLLASCERTAPRVFPCHCLRRSNWSSCIIYIYTGWYV